ncbi:cache domain-containing protein [Motiliproteus sediminis]|uniref:cache domain-containing protein n=1 Tax=Motiliproteus sediminis TaxID=1468178 RepID=UPI001AF00D30|nr:cache domain-containing protein [Motiliproteus sediminis]
MFMKSSSSRRLLVLWLALAGIGAVILVASLQQLHRSLLEERTRVLEDRVRAAYQQVDNFHLLALNGDITRQQAQIAALSTLRQLRYADDEYFWVLDDRGTVLMHAVLPDLEGAALAGISANLDAAVQPVMSGMGRGFFEYQWPRVGDTLEVDKIGFLIHFDPWGWGIASSVYTDDINQAFWDEANNLILIGAILLAVLIIFWFGFEKSLFMDMNDYRRSRDLADGR